MQMAAAAAAQQPMTRNPAPPVNPYTLDPKDHPQAAARPPTSIPAEQSTRGMVLGPRDANGGYMVIPPA